MNQPQQQQPGATTRAQVALSNAYTLGYLDGYDGQPRAPHLHRFTKKQTAAYNRGHAEGLDLSDNR